MGTLTVRCNYSMHDIPVTKAAVFPQSTLNGSPPCSSHSGTMSYETYVAGGKNPDVYTLTS